MSKGGAGYAISGLGKEYVAPSERLTVLKNVNLEIAAGESLAIMGSSGSGKTTLLHIMGALDVPSFGEIFLGGRSLPGLTAAQGAELRNREIGFVFQFHHLLPEFTTLENVAMPALIAQRPRSEALDLAAWALAQVGLEQRMQYRVTTLSGGERQRAAVARAISLRPKVLLADEPTGSLDEATGHLVGQTLMKLNTELGMTLVVVTHNHSLAGLMSRRLELHGGELYARA